MRRQDIIDRKDEIVTRLKKGETRSSIARELDCKLHTLSSYLKSWGLGHLKNQSRKGLRHQESRKPASFYLRDNGQTIHSHKLKIKLWEDELKPEYCEKCGWAEVSIDGRLPLELDHIDGNHYNNKFENLQILCPNCHSLKPGNSGAGMKWVGTRTA